MSGLQDRIDELEEEVRQLRELLAPVDLAQRLRQRFRLNPQESRLLTVIASREFASTDAIIAALWDDIDDSPDDLRIIQVLVCRVRKAIPEWAVIKTHWARGYSMDADTRSRLRGEVERTEQGLRPAGEAAS